MFTQRRVTEIKSEIAQLNDELKKLNDKTPLFNALRAAFGEMDWERDVVDGCITCKYGPSIEYMIQLELNETLVEWAINVSRRHSEITCRLRINFDKYNDKNKFELIDEDDFIRLKHPNDKKIIEIIFETGLPDDISFVWIIKN